MPGNALSPTAGLEQSLTVDPTRLRCIECRNVGLSRASEGLVCSQCSRLYRVIDGIPILLSLEDTELSLQSSHETERNDDDLVLRPHDLEARPLGARALARYVRGTARELLLFGYYSAPGLGRKRIQKTQQVVKLKHERRDLDAINAYRTLKRRQMMLLDDRLVDVTPAVIRARIAEHVLSAARRIEANNVLEAGFGDGINFWSLHRSFPGHGLKLTGFDYSFYRTRVAKCYLSGLPAVSLFNGDGKRIPFANRAFDLVYSVHCLEHIPYDNLAVLREMARVGRYVLLIEPFFEQQAFAGKLHLKRADYALDLSKSVVDAGLKVLEFKRIGLGSPYNQSGLLLAASP